jgi:isovaleryl-CoA dehydrogenase
VENTTDVSFDLNEEQQQILANADRFAQRELLGFAARMDAEEWFPPTAFKLFGAAGLLGITVPTEHGGAGGDLFSSGLILQAFARYNHALALSWVAHDNLCLNNIYRHANADQRARFIPGLCSGELVGALGLTEPGAGSDALGSMRTTARREGDTYV